MNILITILPVFFMIGLGIFANKMKIISSKQAESIDNVVGRVLFPIMVFNAVFSTSLKSSMFIVVLFAFLLNMSAIFIGKISGKFIGERFSHISPYLMCTVDGGNICFPLYATIVGSAYIGNIVILDIACIFMVFLIIPLMVSKKTSSSNDIRTLLKNIISTPVIISLLLGFILNNIGFYGLLKSTDWLKLYDAIISMTTGPIIALILFMIGYKFKIEKSSIKPLIKCIITRFVLMGTGIVIFIKIFPFLVQNHEFLIAVLLYFMCPPALVMPLQVSALFKQEEDSNFMSAFISVYMIVTLIVYTLIVVFI